MGGLKKQTQRPLKHLVLSGAAMDSARKENLGRSSLVFFSAPAPGCHATNEDVLGAVLPSREELVLLLADGAGGLPAGEAAAKIAVVKVLESVRTRNSNGASSRQAILEGVDRAQSAIQKRYSESGTTLLVAEIRRGKLRTYHAGDSTCFVTNSNGELRYQTVSHSPTGFGLAGGWISERSSLEHPERHLVCNLLGAEDFSIEMSTELELTSGDTVLLASDGVTDNITARQIISQMSREDLEEAAEELRKLVLRRIERLGAQANPDDYSFLLYRRT